MSDLFNEEIISQATHTKWAGNVYKRQVEDLVGTVEVVVFPRDYEKCQMFLNEDARLFIQGRVSAEDDKASKLILEKVRLFDDMPRELWLQFESQMCIRDSS